MGFTLYNVWFGLFAADAALCLRRKISAQQGTVSAQKNKGTAG